MDRSRAITKSDAVWDLEKDHSAQRPRLRRLSAPCDHHPAYWDYVSNTIFADIAADLLGPDVKFHHSKLNFKASEGGTEVKWHQDIQYWPHTNYSPLTIGVYLHDVGPEQGPLRVLPGSHEGPLYSLYNDDDAWVGCLADRAVGIQTEAEEGVGIEPAFVPAHDEGVVLPRAELAGQLRRTGETDAQLARLFLDHHIAVPRVAVRAGVLAQRQRRR